MRIAPVFAHNPRPWTGAGNHTSLLQTTAPVLIDAGEGLPAHLDDLATALGGTPLARVLLTHGHVDHAGGAAALAARFPTATFAKYPAGAADVTLGVDVAPLADEDLIDAGGVALIALHTPGHAPDHLCFFQPDSGVLFAGDLVINGGTVVVPPSAGGNLRQYLQSLRRVLALQPRRMLPAHGAPVENPAALLRSYLAHRAMRERQIADALAPGATTVDALVARIYQGLDPALTGAAVESVLAHLIKLEEDGRAHRTDDDRWHLR
jgi:hydroxyacylglutathione hydrolase